MEDQKLWGAEVLTQNELELIEILEVPNLIRHRLRILAHCLNCFKLMANKSTSGPLPSYKLRKEWCLQHPYLKAEKSFIPIFLEQLDQSGHEIERIAQAKLTTPLELSVKDLIHSFSTQAPRK